MKIKYKIVPKTKLKDQGVNFKFKKNAIAFKRKVLNNSNKFIIVKVKN